MARRCVPRAASSIPSLDAAHAGLCTLTVKTIAQYGGRYLVRGGVAEVVEGGPPSKTIIIVEFPSMARLREWYASAEYAEALKLRHTALERRLMFVEGVPPP